MQPCDDADRDNIDISFTPRLSEVTRIRLIAPGRFNGFKHLTDRLCRLNDSHDMKREHSTSCGAAVRLKPKARLCEPWVMVG